MHRRIHAAILQNKIEEAPLVKDGCFFNYNSEANEPMLLADGYLPVVISDELVTAPRVKMKYRLEDDRIVAYWAEVEIPLEERRANKRRERNTAIDAVIWRVQRYEQQKTLNIGTDENEETYLSLLSYIQYLRDIPESSAFPNDDILEFDDWKQQNQSTVTA